MFWIVVGGALVIIFGLYFGFGSLTSGQNFLEDVEERETMEYSTYLTGSERCSTITLPDGLGFMGERSSKISRSVGDLRVVSERSVEDTLVETVIEGSINGQLVTFWTRERSEDVANTDTSAIVLLYLRNSDQYAEYTKKESLLARPEFTLIIPYILGDPTIISDTWDSYSYSSVTFQAYILAKITRIVDYVEAIYDSPKIIAYGEGWGSVLARELSISDDRIDLVISNKFAGDPYQTILRNGFKSKQGLINKLYVKDTKGCLPSSVGSFGHLDPAPHIYLGPSAFNSFYSLGTKDLAEKIENRYEKSGFPDNFTYLELEDLNKTNTEEVINSINEVFNSQSITN